MEYLPTILICIGLVAFVALLIASLVSDKKKGKSSCGGSCSTCGLCSGRNTENKEK